MIYILSGNNTKDKNTYLRKLCKEIQPIFVTDLNLSKEMFFDYAQSMNLFGEYSIIVFESFIKDGKIIFSEEDLSTLKDSNTTFVFLEDKLLASVIKKYKKYATIEEFDSKIIKQTPKINIFNIADSFSNRDKVHTWILYREAISIGTSPEEISGIIFWKIKNMILSGTKFFSSDELKKRSSELVSIYHKAHSGDIDFPIGLEQFILSSLSK